MKKIIAFMSLVILVMSITCSAFAWYTPEHAIWLNLNNVQCVNTTTLKYWNYGGAGGSNTGSDLPYKEIPYGNYYKTPWDTSGRIYVYHTVTGGGGNAYTNLFHAVKVPDDDMNIYGNLVGQKWVTPSQWIPIQSTNSAIPYDCHYSVAARGNTKHNENYGATSVSFRIGIEANQ